MLQTPDSDATLTSQPLPLTRGNLKLLREMSSNPAPPSHTSKRPRMTPTKSTSAGTTTTSQDSRETKSQSDSQSAVRERLRQHHIRVCLDYYDRIGNDPLRDAVNDIVGAPRGSPGLSDERISRLQRSLNDNFEEKEETVAGQLIGELFTQPTDRDMLGNLKRVQNTLFRADWVPRIDTSDNPVLQELIAKTKIPATPKPDFAFGVDPDLPAFTKDEVEANGVFDFASVLVDRLRYPFFIVEWKASSTGGNHGDGGNQCARSGAAIVNSMYKLYCKATPSIVTAQLFTKTLSFSSSVDSFLAKIYVHWWRRDEQGQNHWEMNLVASLDFADRDSGRFRQFRRKVDNIMDWGMGTRLQQIKAALAAYRAAAEAKGKQKA